MRAWLGRRGEYLALTVGLSMAGGSAHADWTQITFGPRYTQSSLEWTIPDAYSNPCEVAGNWAISELRWEPSLVGAQLQALGFSKDKSLLIDIRGAMSWIVAGWASDRDWEAPNYGLEVSRTLSRVRGWEGESLVAFGYRWSSRAVAISPLIGWQFRQIALREYGLFSVFQASYEDLEWFVDPCTDVLSVVKGNFSALVASGWQVSPKRLISTYGGVLSGVTAGLSLWAWPEWEWPSSQSPMSWKLEGWVGLAEWKAAADWCMRPEFAHPVSFHHHAHLLTAATAQQVRLRLTPHWNLDVEIAADWAWGPEGEEHLYKSDGRVLRLAVSDTLWKRLMISLQAGYIF
jgi:hypothetical protein